MAPTCLAMYDESMDGMAYLVGVEDESQGLCLGEADGDDEARLLGKGGGQLGGQRGQLLRLEHVGVRQRCKHREQGEDRKG